MFGEQHAFGLEAAVCDRVAEQEAALFVGVAVQVEEGEELAPGLLQQRLHRVARGLEGQVGQMVESVQVLSQSVHAVMAVENAVRVEHGDDEEVELSSQFGSRVVVAG